MPHSAGEIYVRIRIVTTELRYACDTAEAAFTRMDRATWPQLPLWKRIVRTYRRKGW